MDQIRVTVFPDGRMDTRNAAAYTGFSVKTLAMLRCTGGGPAFIKRGKIFYYKSDLDAWLNDAARVRSTSEARLHAV